MISGGRVLFAGVGAGCKNVEVGALVVFRGVKCCCKVENAGRMVFWGSSFGASALFILMLVVRLSPASLADAL